MLNRHILENGCWLAEMIAVIPPAVGARILHVIRRGTLLFAAKPNSSMLSVKWNFQAACIIILTKIILLQHMLTVYVSGMISLAHVTEPIPVMSGSVAAVTLTTCAKLRIEIVLH